MNIQEMATLVQNRLPVKIVILNNNFLGMVRQWQELFFDKRYSRPAWNCRSTSSSWPRPTVPTVSAPPSRERSKRSSSRPSPKGPVIMEFKIAREEKVLPMVPAGASLNEMVLAS